MEYETDFLEVGIVGFDGWGVGWVSFLESKASSYTPYYYMLVTIMANIMVGCIIYEAEWLK